MSPGAYSGGQRPAWRMIQTGVQSVLRRCNARNQRAAEYAPDAILVQSVSRRRNARNRRSFWSFAESVMAFMSFMRTASQRQIAVSAQIRIDRMRAVTALANRPNHLRLDRGACRRPRIWASSGRTGA